MIDMTKMFESILSTTSGLSLPIATEIFVCIIGRKVSKAMYYLDDAIDVVKLLQGLATASKRSTKREYKKGRKVDNCSYLWLNFHNVPGPLNNCWFISNDIFEVIQCNSLAFQDPKSGFTSYDAIPKHSL
ncbi:hypothetical protein QYF36_014464 [Acer negundo]|nr:hypothetical protein QYF36_014464 [Acer negundo]